MNPDAAQIRDLKRARKYIRRARNEVEGGTGGLDLPDDVDSHLDDVAGALMEAADEVDHLLNRGL